MSARVNGQGWARFGLGFGATLSIIGNVAHTVLAQSDVSLGLRVPFAVAWPVALFIGIEILVRVDWRERFIDHAGRVLLWGPAGAVAAVVSYLHLHALMLLAGEDWFSALAGPLVIDGLMIGSTVALLAIRARRIDEATEPLAPAEAEMIIVHPEVEAIDPVPELEPAGESMRKPRAAKAAQEKAVRLMLETAPEIDALAVARITGVGLATVRMYASIMRMLRDDPAAEIGTKFNGRSVNAELVNVIREWANLERAR